MSHRISAGPGVLALLSLGLLDVLLDGQSTGVVELPISRILDDYAYYGGSSDGSMPSSEMVDRIYGDEFDVAYEEGGLYVLTMHPRITGRRSRALWLEKLIAYMKTKPGVWFATHEDVARHVKTAATMEQARAVCAMRGTRRDANRG